jgi:predicted transcriptional regulator
MPGNTVGFSISEEEEARLDRLAQHFAQGNRSAFLRIAIKNMERIERAERLRDLQTYGVARAAEAGLTDVPVEEIVRRVLAEHGIVKRT